MTESSSASIPLICTHTVSGTPAARLADVDYDGAVVMLNASNFFEVLQFFYFLLLLMLLLPQQTIDLARCIIDVKYNTNLMTLQVMQRHIDHVFLVDFYTSKSDSQPHNTT